MANAELVVEIKAELDELKKAFNGLRKQIEGTSKFARRQSPFKNWENDLRRLRGAFLSLKTAIAGALAAAGVGVFTKSIVDAAASAEQLRLRLQVVTGEGEKTFQTLLAWASKLPISTEKAVDMFISLQAMGLRPTLDQMTLLVDTALALGGSVETVEGIGRALGQIASKGKLSMEEVLQLAERGVPVFEILREELGLTKEELSQLGDQGISASEAIAAIFRGLEKRFKGASKEFAGTWKGLMEQLSDLWYRFRLTVAESGPFQVLKKAVSDLIDFLNTKTGQIKLQEWATATGKAILWMVKTGVSGLGTLLKAIALVRKGWAGIRWTVEFLTTKIAEFGMKAELVMRSFFRFISNPFKAEDVWKDFKKEWDRLGQIAEEMVAQSAKRADEAMREAEESTKELIEDTEILEQKLEEIEQKSRGKSYFNLTPQPSGARPKQVSPGQESSLQALREQASSYQKWQEEIQKLNEKRAQLEEWLTEHLKTETQKRIEQLELERDQGINTLMEAYGKGLITFEELQLKMTQIEEVYSKKRQEILEEERKKREELTARTQITQIRLAEQRGEISPVESVQRQLEIYRGLAQRAQERLSGLSPDSSEYAENLQLLLRYQSEIDNLQSKLQELTGTFDEGFLSAVKRVGQEMASTFRMGQQLAQQLISTISSTLSNVIYDAFVGKLKSAKEYLRSFAQSMLSFLSQLIAKLIVVKSLQAAGLVGGRGDDRACSGRYSGGAQDHQSLPDRGRGGQTNPRPHR